MCVVYGASATRRAPYIQFGTVSRWRARAFSSPFQSNASIICNCKILMMILWMDLFDKYSGICCTLVVKVWIMPWIHQNIYILCGGQSSLFLFRFCLGICEPKNCSDRLLLGGIVAINDSTAQRIIDASHAWKTFSISIRFAPVPIQTKKQY